MNIFCKMGWHTPGKWEFNRYLTIWDSYESTKLPIGKKALYQKECALCGITKYKRVKVY